MPMAVARGKTKAVHGWWFKFADDHTSEPPEIWGEVLRLEEVRKIQGKTIIAINLNTHEQRTYKTTAEAGKDLGISQSSVSMVARGEIHSTAGWWFKFEGSNTTTLPEFFGTDLTRQKRDKTVYAFNLETGEKQQFRNCTVTDQELELYKGAAASVCSGARVSAAGWWFSWDETANPPLKFKGILVAEARSKAIVAINIDTGQEYLFESAKVAAPILGMSRSAISQVLAGKKKFVKGFMFRFQNKALDMAGDDECKQGF
jgi:predicted XRE-type DNA-binding protein